MANLTPNSAKLVASFALPNIALAQPPCLLLLFYSHSFYMILDNIVPAVCTVTLSIPRVLCVSLTCEQVVAIYNVYSETLCLLHNDYINCTDKLLDFKTLVFNRLQMIIVVCSDRFIPWRQ